MACAYGAIHERRRESHGATSGCDPRLVGRRRGEAAERLAQFEERWKKQEDRSAPVPQQVDHRLIGSGLARVRWELDILRRWQRDPNFYEQSLTPVGEALGVPGPYDAQASAEILARLNSVPAILNNAEKNLDAPPAPFGQMAIDSLAGIGRSWRQWRARCRRRRRFPQPSGRPQRNARRPRSRNIVVA